MTIIISNDNNRVEIDVNDNDPIEVQLDYLAGYLAGLRDQGVNIDALDIEYDMEALLGVYEDIDMEEIFPI